MSKKTPSGKSSQRYKKPVKIKPNFIKIPGTARNYKNTKTGKIISRRQYEKLHPPTPLHKLLGRKKSKARVHKNRIAQKQYQRIVQDFIREKKSQGVTVGKQAARTSRELRETTKFLRSRNPDVKAEGIHRLGRGTYAEIFNSLNISDEELITRNMKLKTNWKVISKKTGAIAIRGSYAVCRKWIAFGTRRKRYWLIKDDIDEDGDE